MKKIIFYCFFGFLLFGITTPTPVSAGILDNIKNYITGDESIKQSGPQIPFSSSDVHLKDFKGGDSSFVGARQDGAAQANNALFFLIGWFQKIFGIIITYIIVHAGYDLLNEEDDKKRDDLKKYIINSAILLSLSFLIEPFVRNVLYGGGDVLAPGTAVVNPQISTAAGIAELAGFMDWVKLFLGIGVVIMIIITALQSFFTSYDESATDPLASHIKWVAGGGLLLALNEVLVYSGLYGNPELTTDGKVKVSQSLFDVASELTGLYGFILGFVAIISFVFIMYGGYTVALSTDEAGYEKGMHIIQNSVWGILLVFLSFSLVATFVGWLL
ncbi:hypothetical protein COB57_00680 [Candidatus Peregrinibacteria bacterium]|nr:MAG: hypothetical protein COB57_00680 [Candidatus Peregrinibacteria bacterium]